MPSFEVVNEAEPVTAVRFSHGQLRKRDRHRLKWKCYKQKDISTSKEKKIVTAELDDMMYVGRNFESHNRIPTDTCSYYMGVLDKSTGKIRVITTELFQLEPWIEDKRDKNELDTSKATFKEKNDALTKEFGSGRSQRTVLKREKNKLNDEMVSMTTKTVVDSPHTQMQTSDAAGPVKTETSAIPPFNIDATRPEDVYKLKDIISPDLMSSLAEHCQVFYNCTNADIDGWRAENTYCSFVLDKLATLSVRDDARLLQCQCLSYLNYLMKVFLMKSHQLRSKDPLPREWPHAVRKHILATFTLEMKERGKFKRCVPARLRDLLLSHILVMCLKLSNFSIEFGPLLKDIGVPHKRLATHFTTLGCKIKRAKNTISKSAPDIFNAVLTIPLTFPEIKGKIAKKRIF